jgi:hypothetical protein
MESVQHFSLKDYNYLIEREIPYFQITLFTVLDFVISQLNSLHGDTYFFSDTSLNIIVQYLTKLPKLFW